MALLFPDSIRPKTPIGGKAHSLWQLSKTNLPIPHWAVVLPNSDLNELQLDEFAQLGPGPYAVRSSGLEEDGSQQSFAGQFDSFLFVEAGQILEKIEAVRNSKSSKHLQTYRKDKETKTPPALIQQMISPKVSGVAFSVDPVSGKRDLAVISACWGVGSGVVSGDCDTDVWHVNRNDVIEHADIAKKYTLHKMSAEKTEGVDRDAVPFGKQMSPCLSEDKIIEVAHLARQCAHHFNAPQDIEWCFDESGKLWLLQSRPITTLATTPDPDATITIWDNSNIAESYSGVTTPLTFSFAKRAYENVYREFCRLFCVSEKRIEDNDVVFKNMLGLIHGRVYYNLVSWYRVLALLPGFQSNRKFMEQMMGVKKELPAEIVDKVVKENKRGVLSDRLNLVKTVFGLIRNYRQLEKSKIVFQHRLETALGSYDYKTDWSQLTAEELVTHYQDLEKSLLKKWDAPLTNDFFAMLFYGVLKSLCKKWLKDRDGSLQNELLLDSGDIISAEPPRRIMHMSRLARAQPEIGKVLAKSTASVEEKLSAMDQLPSLRSHYNDYLQTFGDRCLEELKLESPNISDDPQTLLTSIGNFAMSNRDFPSKASLQSNKNIIEDITYQLKNPVKKSIFSWVLKHARDRVRDRENLRFERTRLFGRVRKIMQELGVHLYNDHQIKHPRDIFYLEIEEILNLYNGTATSNSLSRIVASRKSEFSQYRKEQAPPDRFQTRGPLYRYREFEADAEEVITNHSDVRQGVPACSGIIRGRVRVVDDPRKARLEEGEILVAQQTDPGWVILFPSASGLIVERGSLLSHSAIVSREMNLPCVVSLTNVCQWLKTGDMVEMNGKTGLVKKIE